MRLGWILGLWNRLWFPVWRAYARLRRAHVHPSVELMGRPLIRCARGSSLRLGPGVRAVSVPAANPVIGSVKARICTIAPGAVLDIGADVGMSAPCICAALEVIIGEGTLIGADALITDCDFHLPAQNWRWTNANAATAKPVRIGKGCFIGARSIVLKGVAIGDGAVIAAGAMVNRNVPAGHMAIGNPAITHPLAEKWQRDANGNPIASANPQAD